jgi:uncharacterized protein (TIRG00374 family)
MPRIRWRRWIGGAAALAGLFVFARVFAEYDVAGALLRLPAALLLLVPLMGVRMVLGALSWKWSFPRLEGSRPLPWRHLFWIRLAGEAVNNGLVSAYVAGEPVKGLLAARYGPRPRAALASALTGKTLHTLGEALFVIVGAGVAAGLAGTASLARWMVAAGAVATALLLLVLLLQRRRLLGRGLRILKALRLGPRRFLDRALPAADAVDGAIHAYYRDQPLDVARALLFGFLDWAFGVVEVWAFLAVATPVEDPFLLAVVIEAAIDVVKGLSFFVPGSLGAQEGGITWLFAVLGPGVTAGGAYAVLRRLREAVWIGLGLAALSWYLRRPATAPVLPVPAREAS